MSRHTTALWTLAAALAVGGVTANAKETTLTGKVGDAMCGVKHMMADEAACTQGCVKKGADYALIVKDKVYTLKTSNDSAKAQLDKLAGKRAKIAGDQNGDTIQVASVQAAK